MSLRRICKVKPFKDYCVLDAKRDSKQEAEGFPRAMFIQDDSRDEFGWHTSAGIACYREGKPGSNRTHCLILGFRAPCYWSVRNKYPKTSLRSQYCVALSILYFSVILGVFLTFAILSRRSSLERTLANIVTVGLLCAHETVLIS